MERNELCPIEGRIDYWVGMENRGPADCSVMCSKVIEPEMPQAIVIDERHCSILPNRK
jgi:hypothetical protein